MSWKRDLGSVGELAVIRELETRGWTVTDLNASGVERNVDLIANRDQRTVLLQVKTFNDYRWISGGSVNPTVCAGGPIFNRATNARFQCTHVICVTPASPGDKREVRNDWRYFIMPVDEADRLFRLNVHGYFNTPKRNGEPKSKSGPVQDFVGPGSIRTTTIPIHPEDYAPYENAWEILE